MEIAKSTRKKEGKRKQNNEKTYRNNNNNNNSIYTYDMMSDVYVSLLSFFSFIWLLKTQLFCCFCFCFSLLSTQTHTSYTKRFFSRTKFLYCFIHREKQKIKMPSLFYLFFAFSCICVCARWSCWCMHISFHLGVWVCLCPRRTPLSVRFCFFFWLPFDIYCWAFVRRV